VQMTSETMALKATDEPMLIKASRKLDKVHKAMEYSGNSVLGSTCGIASIQVVWSVEVTYVAEVAVSGETFLSGESPCHTRGGCKQCDTGEDQGHNNYRGLRDQHKLC